MVRYNPCTAFFLLLHFFDNCKYSATFWQKCRFGLRNGYFLFIIALSWFFLWEKESCDEDKGIIGRQLSNTCAYRAFSEDIHQNDHGWCSCDPPDFL